MRRGLLFVVAAAIGLAVAAAFSITPSANAQADTCPTNDGKYELDTDNPGESPAPGITVTSEGENSLTFTIASGTTLDALCVKSGEDLSGHSVTCSPDNTFPITGPATCTVTTGGTGNGISHLSFNVSTTPTPTPEPTPTPTPEPTPTPTPEPTPTPTPEPTPSPTPTPTPEPTPTPTPEPTPTPTPEPTPGPTPTPTPEPTPTPTPTPEPTPSPTPTPTPTPEPTPTPSPTPTPAPPPPAGGGAGAGPAPTGQLPFTGLPLFAPLALGGLLLAAGYGLWRRGRDD
jgi:hypothetical protein